MAAKRIVGSNHLGARTEMVKARELLGNGLDNLGVAVAEHVGARRTAHHVEEGPALDVDQFDPPPLDADLEIARSQILRLDHRKKAMLVRERLQRSGLVVPRLGRLGHRSISRSASRYGIPAW